MSCVPVDSSNSTPPRHAGHHGPSCFIFLVLTVAVLGSDLVIKHLAFEHVADTPVRLNRQNATQPGTIPHHDPVRLVPYLLSLKLTLNTGAVFGMDQGRQWLFIVISVIAVIVLGRVFCTSRAKATWTHVSLALILAGALGNLYDRVRYQAVRDMLFMFPGVKLPMNWQWPGRLGNDVFPWVFNLADAALVTGVALMLIIMWSGDQRSGVTGQS